MIHNWQFSQMWKYFNYSSNAVFQYSEAIAKLSDEVQEQVYTDISSRMRQYVISIIPNSEQLYQFVGIVMNDLYRTMNAAVYYTYKQQVYLNATANVIVKTLQENHIIIHFGTNNTFSNAVAVKRLFSAFYEDCGLCLLDVYSMAERLEEKEINNHEGLINAYEKNKTAVKTVMNSTAKRLNAASRSYALLIPDGAYSDFDIMINTVETPGHMVFFKGFDAESGKYTTFDYISPNISETPNPITDAKIVNQNESSVLNDSLPDSQRNKKVKNAMKRILKSFTLFFAIAIAFIFIYPSFVIGFYQGNGDVYFSDRDGMDMILQMNQDGFMSIYQYSSTLTLGIEHYYGLQTQYEYNAILYNNVIGPLHALPEERLPLWKRYALFDGNKQERALVEMKAVSNKGLMVDTNQTEAVKGVFQELLIIEDNRLTLGDVSFIKAEGEELEMINEVIDDFLKYSELIH